MRIQKIKIKEFKAIHDLEKEISGANLIITGENGLGKSSVMQFIEIALGKTTNIPPDAEGEGHVVVDKNGNKYTFFVKFKDGKPVLTVTTPDGLSDSRKGTIASIVGAINFDINKFVDDSKSEKGRKDQVETFKNLLPPDVLSEINKLEANVKYNYDLRADVNRAIKAISGKIELHPMNKPGIDPDDFKPIDVSACYDQLREAMRINQTYSEVRSRMEMREAKIADTNNTIAELEKSLELMKQQLKQLQEQQIEAAKYLNNNPVVDITELEGKISAADETNAKAKLYQELTELFKEQEILKEQSGTLTANIDSQRQAISDAIKDMSNPVPGLMFDDSGLLYNGIPVSSDSLSFSEIIELGVKMKIAENPELPIFISNGESIGIKRLEAIMEIARRNNLQVIMEQMERGQETLQLEIMEG